MELLVGRLVPAGVGAGLGRQLGWELEDLAADPAAWRRTRAMLLRELQEGDRGAIDFDGLLGRGGRDLAEYRLPTGKHVPIRRVRLDLEPATVKQVLDADPGTLTASERLLQQDYRRHLVDSHGAPLDQEALQRRLQKLRADGRS